MTNRPHTTSARRGRRKGATLVELAVAMTISAILVGLVYMAWTYTTRHAIEGRRTAIFTKETQRIAERLAARIRTSPRVLSWHTHGVVFVSARNGDTLHYDFFDEQLLCNDTPVTTIAERARITELWIEAAETTSHEPSETVLLSITLTMADDFGNTTTVTVEVAARVPPQTESEGFDEWSF
jgi:prepilin-type N-terminal cleavage/methylation domain-containing protein